MKRKWQKLTTGFLFFILLITGLPTNTFPQQGIITMFAGGGPNSTLALSADITPVSVAADTRGNLFIAGHAMHQVFKVVPAGDFTVVAGTGIDALSGDGGPASQASLAYPSGVAVDAQGDIFIAEAGNCVIRRVDAVTGIITTVAGNSQFGLVAPGFSGDGGPATSALLNFPIAVALDTQGNLFIADTNNNRIRRVDAVTGIITTVAGNGAVGSSGDNGLATKASLNGPGGMVVDALGNLFFVDAFAIRRVDAVSGIITTFAGNHIAGYSGDGGRLSAPVSLSVHSTVFQAVVWPSTPTATSLSRIVTTSAFAVWTRLRESSPRWRAVPSRTPRAISRRAIAVTGVRPPATAALGPAQGHPPKEPFMIQIIAAGQTVKVGTGVDIEILLKNTSAEPLSCSANISDLTGQDPYFRFDVRDDHGHLVPKRVYPHPELAEGHPIMDCTVRPGETRTEGQDVARIYDMTRPGEYVIQVFRAISSTNEKAGLVGSNKITVTVTP